MRTELQTYLLIAKIDKEIDDLLSPLRGTPFINIPGKYHNLLMSRQHIQGEYNNENRNKNPE